MPLHILAFHHCGFCSIQHRMRSYVVELVSCALFQWGRVFSQGSPVLPRPLVLPFPTLPGSNSTSGSQNTCCKTPWKLHRPVFRAKQMSFNYQKLHLRFLWISSRIPTLPLLADVFLVTCVMCDHFILVTTLYMFPLSTDCKVFSSWACYRQHRTKFQRDAKKGPV